MWTFTTDGFYSAVEDRDDPSILVVRCRDEGDAIRLKQALANQRVHVPVVRTPAGDYRWRLFVPRGAWATYLHNVVEAIGYTNFKNEVLVQQGHDRADLYADVWATMLGLQRG